MPTGNIRLIAHGEAKKHPKILSPVDSGAFFDKVCFSFDKYNTDIITHRLQVRNLKDKMSLSHFQTRTGCPVAMSQHNRVVKRDAITVPEPPAPLSLSRCEQNAPHRRRSERCYKSRNHPEGIDAAAYRSRRSLSSAMPYRAAALLLPP